MVERRAYRKIIMRSDNEPAILASKEAARKESDMEIVLEEVPVGDRQANGLAENSVKNVQGKFRVLKKPWREDTGDEKMENVRLHLGW